MCHGRIDPYSPSAPRPSRRPSLPRSVPLPTAPLTPENDEQTAPLPTFPSPECRCSLQLCQSVSPLQSRLHVQPPNHLERRVLPHVLCGRMSRRGKQKIRFTRPTSPRQALIPTPPHHSPSPRNPSVRSRTLVALPSSYPHPRLLP